MKTVFSLFLLGISYSNFLYAADELYDRQVPNVLGCRISVDGESTATTPSFLKNAVLRKGMILSARTAEELMKSTESDPKLISGDGSVLICKCKISSGHRITEFLAVLEFQGKAEALKPSIGYLQLHQKYFEDHDKKVIYLSAVDPKQTADWYYDFKKEKGKAFLKMRPKKFSGFSGSDSNIQKEDSHFMFLGWSNKGRKLESFEHADYSAVTCE